MKVVTVFANDPTADHAPSPWDRACGFRSASEAARVRREEDLRACSLLGASAVWLPYSDIEYPGNAKNGEIVKGITGAVRDCETLLIPGFPLVAPDHLWLAKTLLEKRPVEARIGLYVEQPYANWRFVGRGGRVGAQALSPSRGLKNLISIMFRTKVGRSMQQPFLDDVLAPIVGQAPEWFALPMAPRHLLAKHRAVRAYRSQVRAFGPLVPSRIALYELAWGGEGLAWLPAR